MHTVHRHHLGRFAWNLLLALAVINALLLVLLAAILDDTFVAYRPISVLVGGALVGALGLILETLLGATPPVLDRDYLDRNGLT